MEGVIITMIDEKRISIMHREVERIYRIVLTVNGAFLMVDDVKRVHER